MTGWVAALVGRRLAPDGFGRWWVRRLLHRRLRRIRPDPDERPAARRGRLAELAHADLGPPGGPPLLRRGDLPGAFWRRLLGEHGHAGASYWPRWAKTLSAAEHEILQLAAERAGIDEGRSVLELGSGGAFARWAARQRPACRVTVEVPGARDDAMVASPAAALGAADAGLRFDRVLAWEPAFAGGRPVDLWRVLAERLRPGGLLFVQTPCHWRDPYRIGAGGELRFLPDTPAGTLYPSTPLLETLANAIEGLELVDHRELSGEHYERTARAWRRRLDRHRAELAAIVAAAGLPAGGLLARWRFSFLGLEAMYGLRGGQEWWLGQTLLRRR